MHCNTFYRTLYKTPILALALTNFAGCGDEVCGPEPGLPTTLNAAIGTETVSYGEWRSSPNNDCGETGGPVSLTLEAIQVGTSRGFTLCFPRPDKLSGTVDIASSNLVQVIDVFADLEPDCLASLDRTKANAGTINFSGVCDDGTAAEGYSMEMQIDLPMTVTCSAGTSEERLLISAEVAVTATVL